MTENYLALNYVVKHTGENAGINSHETEEVLTRYLIFASLPVAQQGSVSDMFPLV